MTTIGANRTGRGSLTARLAAAYRARATSSPSGQCYDPWAQYFAGDEAAELLRIGDSAVPEMALGVALRTRWLDEQVRATACAQIVLLGAGFDTRAARLARAGLTFFEIDHPATQSQKRAALARVASYPHSAATMIGCDLERQSIADALVDSAFRRGERALVLWEGVTPYLTESAVRSTLRELRALLAPGSRIVFDYVSPSRRDGVAQAASRMGEPFVYMPDDVQPLLAAEGFHSASVTSMRSIFEAANARGAGDGPFFDRWFLAHVER